MCVPGGPGEIDYVLYIDTAGRNIVATVNLECRLDLKTIALHARNAEYNPKVRISADPGCRPGEAWAIQLFRS